MENQKINCTVSSCKYNNCDNKKCELKQITVTPIQNCQTKKPDESMCSSYKNEKDEPWKNEEEWKEEPWGKKEPWNQNKTW